MDTAEDFSGSNAQMAYTLLESSIKSLRDVLIFSIDTNYQYLHFNEDFKLATYQAYGTEVKVGTSMLDSITNTEDKEKARRNCERALSGESHTTLEVYGDLERSYFETRYGPIIDDEGKIIGATILSSNVTERKLAEEKIEALNQDLEAFSYTVAHDLRSPLRIINGFCGILIEDHYKALNEECQNFLKVISDNTLKMSQMIDNLLKFSKMGRSAVTKRKVIVKPLIQDIIAEQRNGFGNKSNLEIKLGHLEDLNCDEALMEVVFSNLISNAIKYSRKQAPAIVEIDSFKDSGSITYTVRDNGAGFDMAYSDKLFNAFQRLHLDDEFEGIGIGLATVKRVITAHNGEVWAESEVDKGATFSFRLPA